MTNSTIKISKPDVAVQYGLGSASDGSVLSNLWLEVTKPENCNLACSYCYASAGERQGNSLGLDDWLNVLDQAKSIGISSIGIPGAGEPFHPGAIDRTLKVLERCKDLGIYVTLFTTGEFITEELADRLYQLPVELMIKGNSLISEVQDAFVSNPAKCRNITGYGIKRNNTLEMLMKKGFNDEEECQKQFGRKSRMAIVTSIMTDNIPDDQVKPISPEEIHKFAGLLQDYKSLGLTQAYRRAISETLGVDTFSNTSNYREIAFLMAYARINNLIFDVDSVLERGRGATCNLCIKDERMKAKFQELQKIDSEVFDYQWGVNTTYIGVACERPRRHLYLDHKGEIRPCIGATGVNLGNIKDTTLMQAWETPEMEIIRTKSYKGKCADECANFVELDSRTGQPLCNSCLGRSTEELTNETLLKTGYIKTIGCWNFRDRK